MSRVDEIRALIAANGYGDGGISIGTARDLLALYDEANTELTGLRGAARCERCEGRGPVCEVEAPGFSPGNALCCSCIAIAYEDAGRKAFDETEKLRSELAAATERAERLGAERTEHHKLLGDAYHAFVRWASDEDGIHDEAWTVFERIAMELAWPTQHSRGTSPASPYVHQQLRDALLRAERAEALAADRGEQFARMHADRDAWRARTEKAEALAASRPAITAEDALSVIKGRANDARWTDEAGQIRVSVALREHAAKATTGERG